MAKTPHAPANIDGYISDTPAAVRPILSEIRRVIRAATPEAEEVISYGMPAFKQQGILFISRPSRTTSVFTRRFLATQGSKKLLNLMPAQRAISSSHWIGPLPAYREIFHAPYRVISRVDQSRVVILTLRHWRRARNPADVDVGA